MEQKWFSDRNHRSIDLTNIKEKKKKKTREQIAKTNKLKQRDKMSNYNHSREWTSTIFNHFNFQWKASCHLVIYNRQIELSVKVKWIEMKFYDNIGPLI